MNSLDNTNYATDNIDFFLVSTLLALNTCYHVGLQSNLIRKKYREELAQVFNHFGYTHINEELIHKKIDKCYQVILDETLDNLFQIQENRDAISKNQALKENVFMMMICIELKIPLFVVGKPGSSKSLAKTLVSQNSF